MSLLTLKNFFTVLKCPSCGEPLELGREGNGVLCSSCREKWENCKNTICNECGNTAVNCRCLPPLMKSSSVYTLIKLGFYESKSTVIQNVVLYMKDFKDKRVFDFVSLELSSILEAYINENSINISDLVFTYSPRSRKNLEKSGFDQASELSKRCAKNFGVKSLRLVKRKYFSKNQKGLNNDERLRNARNSLIPNSKIDIKGRTVVIIDDVVTTGASLSACARAIKSLGAKKIICLSVTKTFEKNE